MSRAVKILTGPCIVGHIFRDETEAIERALPVLVGAFADCTELDVHHTEAHLVECRGMGDRVWTEVRVAGHTVGSWGPA